MTLNNQNILEHKFLSEMYNDSYFPDFLVDKGVTILLDTCKEIEEKEIDSLNQLYTITHKATEKFNNLAEEFEEKESEIETVARDAIATDFKFIADSYGFNNADMEELIAPRDW